MADNFFKVRNGLNVGSLASAPANPMNGDMYYDTTLNQFQIYDNGSWQSIIGSFANVNLSNLASPTSINQDLLFQFGINVGDNLGNAPSNIYSLNSYNLGSTTSLTNQANGNSITVAESGSEYFRFHMDSLTVLLIPSDLQGIGVAANAWPGLTFLGSPAQTGIGWASVDSAAVGTGNALYFNTNGSKSFSVNDSGLTWFGNQSIYWATDGAGNIGASLANRPGIINVMNSITIAGDSGVLGDLTIGSDTSGGQGKITIGTGVGAAMVQFGISNQGSVSVGGGQFALNNNGVNFLLAGGAGVTYTNQYPNWGWGADLQFGGNTLRFGYNNGSLGRPFETALGALSIAHPNNGGTLLIRGMQDIASYASPAGGSPTTTINSSTTLTLSPAGQFTKDIAVGDLVSVSSAPSVYSSVVTITDDSTLQLSTPIGNGSSQTVSVRHSIMRVEDRSGSLQFFMDASGLSTFSSNLVAGAALGIGYEYSTSTSNEVINDNISYFILDPATTIATKTITMPANPFDTQEVTIAGGNTSGGVVTSLTVSPNAGQSINGAPITLNANDHYKWKFVLAQTTWYLVG